MSISHEMVGDAIGPRRRCHVDAFYCFQNRWSVARLPISGGLASAD